MTVEDLQPTFGRVARAEAIVVGGGIVGATAALFLARAGVRVDLYERSFLGAGASRACEGNILAWDKPTEAERSLGLRSQELWASLADDLGPGIEYERKGSLVMAEDDLELQRIAELAHQLRTLGQEVDLLDYAALRVEEPHVAADLPGGALFHGDAQVEPRRATLAIAAEARVAGARLYTGVTVTRLRRRLDGRLVGVDTDVGSIDAPTVIIAAGVWTARLLETCGLHAPIVPRKGQIVVCERSRGLFGRKLQEASYLKTVESDATETQVAMVVEATNAGAILLGSSRERLGSTYPDVRVSAAIARRAARFLPVLERLRVVRTYAGLRPATPDHLPLIGQCALAPGLWLATGHEGAGIGLAPATAELIARSLVGAPPATEMDAFSPDRLVVECHMPSR